VTARDTAPAAPPDAQRVKATTYAYVLAVVAAAAVALAASLPLDPRFSLVDYAVLGSLAALAEAWYVRTGPHSGMSLSFAVHYVVAVLFGPAAAALTVLSGVVVADGLIARRPLLRVAFNAAQMALSAALAAAVFGLVHGSGPLHLVSDLPALALAGLTYLLVNNLLVSVVLSLEGGTLTTELAGMVRDLLVPYAAMAPLGALAAYTYQSSRWTLLYFVPLTVVIYNGFRLFVSLQRETDNALVALADSVDKRDQYTYQHSQRVAALSGEIARAMGLPEREVEMIVAAARVHDLGKIATDNRVLFKQSSLTDEERRLIEEHPGEGGELAGKFSMFRRGRLYIRHHHERWDGSGYPDGLAGEQIPLGARIIAVADAYDAMTSDRPYRAALPHEIALVEIRRGAGTQFDPDVVAAFLATARRHPAPGLRTSRQPVAEGTCSSS